MGFFSGSTVGPTPAEQQLDAAFQQSYQVYQSTYLPVQQHLTSVLTSMNQPNSWERQEAEGKGNADVADAFARSDAQQTANEMDRGINPNSAAFKLGATGSAVAEANQKGTAINAGNEAIDKAYLSGLSSIAAAGSSLAQTAGGALGMAGEVGSREAITNANESNTVNAATMSAVGLGLGAAGMAAFGTPPAPGGGAGINVGTPVTAPFAENSPVAGLYTPSNQNVPGLAQFGAPTNSSFLGVLKQ